MFKNHPIYEADLTARQDLGLRKALYSFVQQPMTYKLNYLQAEFDQSNDGYSYWGQTDSQNQYATDMLHSFVISEFSPSEKFPLEFSDFFSAQWHSLRATVRKLEKRIIRQLEIPGLDQFYQDNIGHMVSCNYYPAINDAQQTVENNTRLSKHKDVSLFSVFLFGLDCGFSYVAESGKSVQLGHKTGVIVFPGYLLELLTEGKIRALEHQVELPTELTSKRFSFAFFSVPKPGLHLKFAQLDMTTEDYFKKYLSLF
jgi:isopenicillin N synthase-like dioxygenase